MSLEEAAALLRYKLDFKNEISRAASEINEKKFNKEIELYAVSYVSDRCINNCSYCGLNSEMKHPRSILNQFELCMDMRELLKYGPADICILSGEHPTITPEYLALAGRTALALD